MSGLGIISHSVVDFVHENIRMFGQALLDNACFKYFMGSDGKNLKELSGMFDLTEGEEDMIAKKKRGHGLLIAGSTRLHAITEVADFEFEYMGEGGGK